MAGIAHLEGYGYGGRAVVRTRRRHVGHAGNAVDLLLEWRCHRVGDHLPARAGITSGYDDLWRGDLGELGEPQQKTPKTPPGPQNNSHCRPPNRPTAKKSNHPKSPPPHPPP